MSFCDERIARLEVITGDEMNIGDDITSIHITYLDDQIVQVIKCVHEKR